MVRGTAAGAPPRPRTASNAAGESSTASTSPAWTASSAARASDWSTRPISATSRARSSRVSTRWMRGMIMAPSQRKLDAPAHPLVPQRIAPGAPATRCDNLLHKYAFRPVPPLDPRQHQALPRSRHPHVQEPPRLLNLGLALVLGLAITGNLVILHPHDVHARELQALGGMQREEVDAIGRDLDALRRRERHALEQAVDAVRQRRRGIAIPP